MRFPRPRITIRRLMVAVAIAGALAGWRVESGRRREKFQRVAAEHGRALGEFPQYGISDPYGEGHPLGRGAYYRRNEPLMSYLREMQAKYTHAARYPWLPVGPDPARPDFFPSPSYRAAHGLPDPD